MKKINKENVKDRKTILLPDYISCESRLFLLPDQSLYKEYKGNLLHEKRHRVKYLIDKFKYVDSMPKELIMPKEAVYDNRNHLIGYTMDNVDGINIEKLEEMKTQFDKTDLRMYKELYYRLKDLIIKVGDNVVFPNLLDARNIIINKDGNLSLICFDDIQIGDIEGYFGSDTESIFGGPELKSKKYYNNGLYTKNMDVRSLILLYFEYAFGINLSYFSKYEDDELEEKVTNFFYSLGIDDSEIVRKVLLLFDETEDNEYIDDFVDYITEEYQMFLIDFNSKKPIKRLTLK